MEMEQETIRTRPGILTGGIAGGLLMAVVLGLSYLGSRAAELPSIPDDFFAFVRDNLPGDVLTAGIDFMVDTLISLNVGNDLDNIAKSMEQLTAHLIVLGVGIVVGALLFLALKTQESQSGVYPLGLGSGLLLGVVMALISNAKAFVSNPFTVGDGLWVVALFVLFGAGLGWIYTNLVAMTAAKSDDVLITLINRRQFMIRVGGAAAVLTVVGAGLGRLLAPDDEATEVASASGNDGGEALAQAEATAEPPPTNPDATLEPAPGTRPEYTPLDDHYRIDISTRPPNIRESQWELWIDGLVESRTTMTLDDIRAYESVDQFVTLACISNRIGGNLISTTRWTGVPLKRLLEDWPVLPEAKYMRITSEDGFDEYVSLDLAREDERVMLAYEWDGKPLKEKHGFPLRIYIPDHYGMKQPKWITMIEMVAEWDEGYWVRRGWSEDAIMRTVSVVDTVAADDIYEEDGQLFVPVGGIAHAGARGISRVEVQVDEGEWTEAQLRAPLSETTWVIWRYDWPFQEGEHRFAVRTYDGTGELQITENNSVRPDGATGIHNVEETVSAPQGSA